MGYGGYIEKDRINGDLLVSRGFGDFEYKKGLKEKPDNQIVTVVPEIMSIMNKGIDYIFMGCDGVW